MRTVVAKLFLLEILIFFNSDFEDLTSTIMSKKTPLPQKNLFRTKCLNRNFVKSITRGHWITSRSSEQLPSWSRLEIVKESRKNWNFYFDLQLVPTVLEVTFVCILPRSCCYIPKGSKFPICRIISLVE